MKTKNRPDRVSTVVMPDAPPAAAAAPPNSAVGRAAGGGAGRAGRGPTGTPKLELNDRKWIVEFQVWGVSLQVWGVNLQVWGVNLQVGARTPTTHTNAHTPYDKRTPPK